MQSHAGDRPNKCGECGAAFIELDKLKRHMRVHASEQSDSQDNTCVCEECGARFTMSRHLKNHMRVHRQVSVEK